MAADFLARGIAAQARDAATPQLARFTDISAVVIPASASRITAGTGASAAPYVADARATAALALAHPLCCRADAAGRYFRLEAVDSAIDFAHTGLTNAGGDMRAAVQAAIAYAGALDIPRVTNRSGVRAVEMWCQAWDGAAYFTSGRCLYVAGAKHLTLDFGGATITVKGPTGNADTSVGQTHEVTPGKLWRGGWLAIVGSDDFEYFALENVHVIGSYPGGKPADGNGFVQADNALTIIDSHVDQLVLRNVEFEKFYGEICVLGGSRSSTGKAIDYDLDTCHFHDGAFSGLNPNARGRLTARNVECGNLWFATESLGGEGQVWGPGCRFYNASQAYLQGGPDPDIESGFHYSYPRRRTDAAPPFITFHDTLFDNVGGVVLTGFARGRILAIDSPVGISGLAPSDVSLDVESWCDKVSISEAVSLSSSAPTLTTQIPTCPDGTYYKPPANIDVRVTCKRTALAKANGRMHSLGCRIFAYGLYDHSTIRVAMAGEASQAWDVFTGSGEAAGFCVPLMEVDPGFIQLTGGAGDAANGDRTYKPAWWMMTMYPSAAATHNVTIDTTGYGYVRGQRIRFRNLGGNAAYVTSFAKNGAGLALNADRTQRRYTDFLELEYDDVSGRWREVAVLDQGP